MFGFGKSSSHHVEVKKPLGFFGKLAAGIKGFVKTAVDYLPRGILFDAVFIGGLALVATQFGFDPLGIVAQGGGLNWGSIAKKALFSLSLGATISGGVGAYREIKHQTQSRNVEMIAQALELQRYREHSHGRGLAHGHDEISVPGGIPGLSGHERTR
jgi:hypothetical protein